MIDNYIKKINNYKKNSREKDNYLFGLCIGFLMFLTNSYFILTSKTLVVNKVNLYFFWIGIILIIISTIYPNIINPIHMLFKKIFNIIGSIIFKLILVIVYYILVVPVGIIIKSKNKKNETTTFVDYEDVQKNQKGKKGIYNILIIFKLFFNEKYILMLPLILILILIGLLLIFAQSSIVTPFIYTLF